MPHIDAELCYTIRLTSREFRLVGLALAGKLKQDDFRPALELNSHLATARANHLKSQLEAAEKSEGQAKSQLIFATDSASPAASSPSEPKPS